MRKSRKPKPFRIIAERVSDGALVPLLLQPNQKCLATGAATDYAKLVSWAASVLAWRYARGIK